MTQEGLYEEIVQSYLSGDFIKLEELIRFYNMLRFSGSLWMLDV